MTAKLLLLITAIQLTGSVALTAANPSASVYASASDSVITNPIDDPDSLSETEPFDDVVPRNNWESLEGASSRYLLAKHPILGWRIKAIHGHVYKRLYNYSAAKWIGSWIPM